MDSGDDKLNRRFTGEKRPPEMTNHKVDGPSQLGKFGWERVGSENLAVPVIIRCDGVRYSPVRIVEQEIIRKYYTLSHQVFPCITLKSFYLTSVEAKLLNNVNFNHCESRYGDAFFTPKDVVISAEDVKGISRFLNISNIIFNKDLTQVSDRLGVLRLQLDPSNPSLTTLIPYITRGKSSDRSEGFEFTEGDSNLLNEAVKNTDGQMRRFIPAKLVDPYLRSNGLQGAPSDWDVMYLKMLCKYCELNPALYVKKEDRLVCLNDLFYTSSNMPPIYEDFRRVS